MSEVIVWASLKYENNQFVITVSGKKKVWNDTCIDLLSIVAERNNSFYISSDLWQDLPDVEEEADNEKVSNASGAVQAQLEDLNTAQKIQVLQDVLESLK